VKRKVFTKTNNKAKRGRRQKNKAFTPDISKKN